MTTPSRSTPTVTSGAWLAPSSTAWILFCSRVTCGTSESLIRLSIGGAGAAAELWMEVADWPCSTSTLKACCRAALICFHLVESAEDIEYSTTKNTISSVIRSA